MRSVAALPLVTLLAACSRAPAPAPSGSAASSAAIVAESPSAQPSSPAQAPSATSPAARSAAALDAETPTALEPPTDPLFGTGPKNVDEVVPGVSIGPVKLGMTRPELDKLGLWVRKFNRQDPDEHVLLVGPYYVVLHDGKVESIEATLTQMTKGLRIRGRVLPFRTSFKETAAAFEDCEPMVRGLCGNWFRCENKRLEVKSGCGQVVQVQIFARTDIYPWEKPSAAAPDAPDAPSAASP